MKHINTILCITIISLASFATTACKKKYTCTITGPGIGDIETHEVNSQSECDALLAAKRASLLNG